MVLAEIGGIFSLPVAARRVSSYAGLVRSTCASRRKASHGAITKRDRRFLRRALVEAAMHAVLRPGPLQDFYRHRR